MPPKRNSSTAVASNTNSNPTQQSKRPKPPSQQLKKQEILTFLQSTYSYYTLKELEKLIPKNCKSISNGILVKDLIKSLLDDDLIHMEKCGNINIIWCFKRQVMKEQFIIGEKLESSLQVCKEEYSKLENDIEDCLQGEYNEYIIDDGNNGGKLKRDDCLRELKELDDKLKVSKNNVMELEKFKWDDERISLEKEEKLKDINRLEKLTDNIEILVSYLSNKFLIDSKQIRKEFGIPEDFKEFS
ncbi:Mnd1p NDAI_0G03430 [Naumovozyma dairenensis CBS 421]|uniref:Meiotic nuclear division protein 1 n=1 Tax=Naumovozyma dairenensis (strain ATCC 10597 / BCRC 20456 / CBS 421 / NBRC 0211 / NRRL Y-12639) TaxID=1071378 RepID=G0WEA9_NAUDC|nr:hypothetical protein NDAI_0G03430 [Naumovozyma dairenensis CBS 421]CCD26120.2 hypothetical protein NDAI_0G03430 [Naumovozyma dairenensis CBS 421]